MDTRERIFEFIVQYKIDNQGNTPSLSMIMRAVNLATKSAVVHHLERLERDNRITRQGRNIYVPGARWVIE